MCNGWYIISDDGDEELRLRWHEQCFRATSNSFYTSGAGGVRKFCLRQQLYRFSTIARGVFRRGCILGRK